MKRVSVSDIVLEDTALANRVRAGQCAQTVFGGHDRRLRQTVVSIRAGEHLPEHSGPGEATLLVLEGRVSLRTESGACEARKGDFVEIPQARHSLYALEDSSVLMTIVVDHGRLPLAGTANV